MKKLIILLFSFSLLLYSEAQLGGEWKRRSANLVEITINDPSPTNVLKLGSELIGVNQYNSGTAEEIQAIDKIVSTLLFIPGHAQFFADEIEMEREKIKDLPPKDGRRGGYNWKRYLYLRSILLHLKSPETITVLGNYLYDERDPTPPSSPAQDWTDNPPNSELAAEALEQIGLKDYPYRAKNDFGNANAVAKNRAWWEEIKSGKKALSFKGQNVEYRFKPDGTWDTIALANPPDDGSKVPTANQKKPEREEIRPPRTIETKKTKTSGNVWAWVIGSVTFLLAILVWLRGKK